MDLWKNFHNSILKFYMNDILVIQYEKLRDNLIEEMSEILSFLGFNMTREIESCLLSDSKGG